MTQKIAPAGRCEERERWLDTSPTGPGCFWRLVEATVSSFTLPIRHAAASRFGIGTRATINRMFTWITHRRTTPSRPGTDHTRQSQTQSRRIRPATESADGVATERSRGCHSRSFLQNVCRPCQTARFQEVRAEVHGGSRASGACGDGGIAGRRAGHHVSDIVNSSRGIEE